jgi:hypothetical protein
MPHKEILKKSRGACARRQVRTQRGRARKPRSKSYQTRRKGWPRVRQALRARTQRASEHNRGITAGHCVYHLADLGGWATQIEVAPGRNDLHTPYGAAVSRHFGGGQMDRDAYAAANVILTRPVKGSDLEGGALALARRAGPGKARRTGPQAGGGVALPAQGQNQLHRS